MARCAPLNFTTPKTGSRTSLPSCAIPTSLPSRASSASNSVSRSAIRSGSKPKPGGGRFHIAYILDFGEDAPGADEHLSVMDIANVQENFRHLSESSRRISALLKPGADFNTVSSRAPGKKLPPDVIVQAPDRRNRQIEKMIGAFQLNLTALSLIALLVGMFLIYNTVATAVVRRRHEIGVLRALGTERTSGPISFYCGGACCLACSARCFGLILGVAHGGTTWLGRFHRRSRRFISSPASRIFLSRRGIMLAALVLCLGAVILAAWFPAREAAAISPVEALSVGHLEEDRARGNQSLAVRRHRAFA